MKTNNKKKKNKKNKSRKSKAKNKLNQKGLASTENASVPDPKLQDTTTGNDTHPAIDYLRKWQDDRSNWSFKKNRQVWLLKNMMDVSKVSESDFKTLIKYMQGLRGSARDTTLKFAKERMDQADSVDVSKALTCSIAS
ncbi:uncharacterized protein TRIADDRAFT_53944 [Trichoplax adhaerens]|uniref:WKF domain-containing protein n=1 Tax=Trichoplax adhaerens TaxID=10228 RepID=B3RMG3_TRIAD|nr:hypothetical protein TRIADDRAFT_53944 [Trichoplax adhaerens]EDV28359.1 hypothetical protein TRIADDRAFT_53944 [Trichoplax adhaerens]|eukprot:XP_002110193.1 hypothetical protein TRIADDRAFT_53944 [Trichoplax adhaerens]